MHHHLHTNPDRFLGQWRLIPDKCIYDVGEPPSEGIYTLTQGSDGPTHVDIDIKWKSAKGDDMSYNYHIHTDATPVIQTFNGQDLRVVSHIDIDGNILKSTSSTLDGKVVMEATRELIQHGSKLEVIMLTHVGDAIRKVYQLYDRVIPSDKQ